MTNTRVLLAYEPLAYREARGGTLRELRPAVEVTIVPPVDLDREVVRLHPHLVLCSAVTGPERSRPPSWSPLYPNGHGVMITSIAGRETTIFDPAFDAVLHAVDRTGEPGPGA